MNSSCYRVIFNKARGMLMVVSEAARSQGKTGNPANGGSEISQVAGASQAAAQTNSTYQGGQLVVLRSHVLLALGLATIVASSVSISNNAYADATSIVADRNAAANQQAIILKSSNGTTQVNIQTPSAAGVSRNVFSKFDVGTDGAILNNSRSNTQTQLAGWVEGNPYLARGEARVILNEVNSSDPSRLSGYTEIAGGRADLVIANPAGISCAGCGFINASRTTLTTGNALMDQGKLTGFDVTGGKVRIDGDGLDTSGSDYTQILAKTSEINAAVYAKNLDVITGSNKVSYEADAADTVITPTSSATNSNASNTATGVALDVSALGAMYAGKIRLIGTDKGMGVTNAGSIIASSGGLQLDNDGNLINSGSLIANQGKVAVNVGSNTINNSGTIASSRDTAELNSSSLDNSGVISSRDTLSLQQTGLITNSGEIATGSFDIKANALNNSGKLLQTGTGQLAIDTSALVNQQGGIIGQDLYANASIPPTVIPTKKPPTTATNGSSVEGDTDTGTGTSTPNLPPLPFVTHDGNIRVATITNTGSLYTNGKINIAAVSAVNQGKSSLAADRINIASNGQISNADSRLQLDQIDWQLATFDNSKGQITATKDITIRSADQIINDQGTIAAMGDIKLSAQNQLKNNQGILQSNANLTTNSSDFDNTEGSVSSKGSLTIDANGNLTNNQGRINSEKGLTVSAKTVTNDQGSFSAQQQLDLVANRLENSGQIYGQTGNQISLTDSLINSGLIASAANTTINASTINQTASGSLIAGMHSNGSLLSNSSANLSVTAVNDIVSQGKHIATGDMAISGAELDLKNSVTQARDITLMATTGNINSQKASIVATDNLILDSQQGGINNQGGEISATVLDIETKRLDNTDGKLTQTGAQDFNLNMREGINNTRGRIVSNANNMTLSTSTLDNSSGVIVQAAKATETTASPSLDIQADSIINNQGQVLSLGAQKWQVTGDINNQSGVIQAQRFDIAAANVDNTDGQLVAIAAQDNLSNTSASQLHVRGTINNTRSAAEKTDKGVIISNTGSLTVIANDLQNNKGQISSADSLKVNSDSFANSGSLYANDISIDNQSQVSNSGSIAAQGNIAINTGSLKQNKDGQLIAGLSPGGELSGISNLTINSRGQQSNAGLNIATGSTKMQGRVLDLSGSRNQSVNMTLAATAGDISLTKANTSVLDLAKLTTTGRLINDSGVLQAGRYDLQVGALSNSSGTLLQTGNQDFTLVTAGDINNQAGYIGGKADRLTVNTQGTLNNNQGSIIHSGDISANNTGNNVTGNSASITANSLLNQQGKLISNGNMNAIITNDLDNTQGGIQAEALQVIAGKFTNLDGQLVSQSGDLQLSATDIVNQGDKAYIQSAQNLNIQAKHLSNSDKATLMAQGAASISADDTLDNTADAVIASNEAMTITSGIINNDAQIASVNQNLTIDAATINNKVSGRMQAADTTITSNQALNNQGLIAATKALNIATSGALNNQAGILSADTINLQSQQDINNDSGLIAQSGSDNALIINSKGLLSNQNTKQKTSQDQQLGIVTNGDAVITSGGLNNQSGLIAADNLAITSLGTASINNKVGQLQANKQLTINAANIAALDNQGGQIGADAVNLTVGNANNGRINNNGAGSLIQASTDLTLTTGTLTNQNTKQASNAEKTQGILAGNKLAINTTTLDNQSGQLLANDKITVTAGNQLNNQSGIINSQSIIITDSNLSGRGLVVTNSQGLINAGKDLSITARGYNNAGGTISAINQADINVFDNINHGQGDIINAADLRLTTQGSFTNSGKLSGQNALTVNAQRIDNLKGAEITSNGTTALNASTDIDNRGLINGINTYLDASNTVNNYSNGRIYGDHVAIEATTLNNTPDVFTKIKVNKCDAGPGCLVETTSSLTAPPGVSNERFEYLKNNDPAWVRENTVYTNTYYNVSSEPAPVIAARRRLDIGVNTLNNNPNQARAGIFNEDFSGQAQIISNGELNIGGRLDNNHYATGRATTVNNKGASIESAGDMRISADTVNNINADFSVERKEVSRTNKNRYAPNGTSTWYDESEVSFGKWGYRNRFDDKLIYPNGSDRRYTKNDYEEVITQDFTKTSDASRIISGGQLTLVGNNYLNKDSLTIAGGEILTEYQSNTLGDFDNQATKGEKITSSENSYNQAFKVGRGWYSGKRRDERDKGDRIRAADSVLSKKIIGLPILNQEINKEVIDYGVNTPKVNELKSLANALQVLTQTTQTTDNQSSSTQVSNTDLADAADLLEKFAKADNSNLTDAQKQQIQDLIAAQNNGKPVNPTQVKDLIGDINTQINQYAVDEIRTSGNKARLPNSSLYGINPDSNADYLIESDGDFTNYKNWLSSNYMLDRLQFDPTITQKRLGDGYYEQQYIRDQIMMLTGRYYLGDYGDQDTQYQGLMSAGVTTAQTLNLRPGIALTADQVARLTTDIVWLVQQDITLADGSIQKVLVPKIYTRQAVSQIDGTGDLVAANNIDIQLTGNLGNQGNIVGHQSLNINANNLTNTNGGIIKGNFVQISTKSDLNNLSATISANSAMQLDVGGNFNNKSLTYSTESVKGASNATRTDIAQIASIYVGDGLKGQVDANSNALTTFVANVGGNTTFAAGRLDNLGGSSFINTTGDVNLNAVNVGYQSNSIGDANNYFNEGASADIGSQLNGNNDIIVKGNNVSGMATQISSNQGTVGIIADGNVDFKEGRSKQNLSTAVKTTDKSFLSKTTTQDRFDSQSDNAISSNIEGNKVFIQAGNNISLTGTNAISDRGTQLTAGGNIDILAAKNTESTRSTSQEKKSGAFGTDGGIGFTIGKKQTDDSNTSTSLTHTASNIGAIDGNVIITAGGTYQQTGSNIVTGMGADSEKDFEDPDRGNTVIRAKEINIDNALDIYTNQSEQKSKQSGVTVSVSNSLVDSAKSINALVDAGGNTDSVRMKGMAGVAGALKVKSLAKEANKAGFDLLDGNLKGMGNTRAQATIGSQKSQSNSSSYTEQNQASNINSNNLALISTGGGTDSNININGSNLTVSNNALFQADNNFNVNGVAQKSNTRSTNKSSSAAIGGYASTGSGVGITASGSRAKGYANSDSTTYANSQINVGGTTTFDIGNDVNIKGGVFNTDKVQGRIKGNVNIESLQDTATYDSNQKNMGFTLDVALEGAGSSLSLNGGRTNVNADYEAVGEQSGIFTGDGGFDLVVDGKTTLIGGAITTTEAAKLAGRNNYISKGGITTQDIENTSSYKGDAISIGLSAGKTTGKPQATMNGLGYGADSDSDSSITKAGITGIAGNSDITTDNREEYAGALENVFDATRVNEELEAQTQITQEFGKEAPKAVADFSGKRQTQLILDGDLEGAEKWADGGAYRVALHTLVGAIATGSVEGALASGITAVSIPAVGKYLEEQGIDETTRDALLLGLSAAVGAVVGGDTASAASSVNQTQNNFLSHKDREALNALLGKAKRNGGLSLKDSESLIYLVQYDQVTNIILEQYRKDPSSLSQKDLDFLAVALNDLMAQGRYDAVAAKTLINGGSAAGYTTDNFLNAPKVKNEVSAARGSFWDNPVKFFSYTRPKSENQEVYNKALVTSNINNRQKELSKLGGDAIYVSPGALGLALRGALAAKGVYDVGYGGAAIYDGKYKEGMVRVGTGVLEIVPAVAYPNIRSNPNHPHNIVLERDIRGNEILYRSMSQSDFAKFQRTGKMPATGETYISPSRAYSSGYEGVLVQIKVKPGTMSKLAENGIAGNSGTVNKVFPNMPRSSKGWTQRGQVQFKLEGQGKPNINSGQGVVNAGLGKGKALDNFNQSIVSFKTVKK